MPERKKAAAAHSDPNPYDGPIERADGCRPFNHYIWPMPGDDWWAYDTFGHRHVSGRFHFAVVGLADGRWSSSGHVYDIERGTDSRGRRIVFDSREKAIRAATAQFIRLCRAARRWPEGVCSDRLSDEMAQRLINWALAIALRPEKNLRPVPKLEPKWNLPLFDFCTGPR